jgi:hypothetical protein
MGTSVSVDIAARGIDASDLPSGVTQDDFKLGFYINDDTANCLVLCGQDAVDRAANVDKSLGLYCSNEAKSAAGYSDKTT